MKRRLSIIRKAARCTAAEALMVAACSLAAGTAIAAATPAEAALDPDTLGVRIEVGATSDLTNELFYEEAFIDTTFLGRRQVSTPETRFAGVLFTGITGTRSERATSYALQNELRLGDKLQRNVTWLNWNTDLAPDWRLSFNPRIEFRKDQTFDRDLEEWRGSGGARIRRAFDDGLTYGEWRLNGEFLRTRGDGADFIPDRNVLQTSVALDHMAFFGQEWRLGYRLYARVFPDSTVRDHFEHGWEGRWKYNFTSGNSFLLESDGARRVTMNLAPTSRDNFWEEWVRGELVLRANERWAIRSRVEVEALQYDVQDTSIYFNYQVLRGRVGPRYDRAFPWTFAIGPTAEVLSSGLNPAEGYQEVGAFVEVEYLGSGGWWSVTPSAGRRTYNQDVGATDPLAIHSAYTYYEISVFGDQRIPGGLRVRTIATARRDAHTSSLDDATSLYFSLDVRRLF